ncbi:hypothetical protein C8R44DRAFT_235983 [Mycena epipterygia]|nr:hypothetical protein C8R44DRAFT_235983 [Mycena epipterygia]
MRALSALPLDDDIVDRIMTFSPTFSSLKATILVSKAFYRVYQTHPKSITRAVAYNVVGPALPQALRFLRFPFPKFTDGHPLPDPVACPEDHIASAITAEEKGTLQRNSRVVARLEDIYSLRNKDRTSRASVLTADESHRFHRAIYRIMLFTTLFTGSRYDLEEIEEMSDEKIERIRRARVSVLDVYPTDELQELHTVARFLRGIFADTPEGSAQPHLPDLLLSTGPEDALSAYTYRTCEPIEESLAGDMLENDDDAIAARLFSGYLSLPLNAIFASRALPKKDLPKDEDGLDRWVLDEVRGANDTCSRCAAPGGLNLYTEANCGRLALLPHQLLKGKLSQNHGLFSAFLQHPDIKKLEEVNSPEGLGMGGMGAVFGAAIAGAGGGFWGNPMAGALLPGLGNPINPQALPGGLAAPQALQGAVAAQYALGAQMGAAFAAALGVPGPGVLGGGAGYEDGDSEDSDGDDDDDGEGDQDADEDLIMNYISNGRSAADSDAEDDNSAREEARAAEAAVGRWIGGLFEDGVRGVRAAEVRAAGLLSMSTTQGGGVGALFLPPGTAAQGNASVSTNTNATASTALDDFSTWKKEDSYCQTCLKKYVVEHVWVWWRAERVKEGWVPPEDCWYGYDCRTQVHRPRHAEQKNHLCVPTRGSSS